MRSPTRRLYLRCLATQKPEDRCCSCERRADSDGRACHGSPLRFDPRLHELLFGIRLPRNHEATELKKRFNEAFWLEDEGFFAMGLDSQKR